MSSDRQEEEPKAAVTLDDEKTYDGSLVAWIQCAGAFVLMMNSWGIVSSFGVFQTFYHGSLLSAESASNVSWIGSLQTFLLIFGGVVSGVIFDKGHLKLLLYSGTFLIVFGMMMTSLCRQYWQAILAQGLVTGLGYACIFIPSLAIIPLYFDKRRALALGVAASGSSFAGVIYPIIFQKLQPQIGFGWATRTIAFIILVTMALPLLGMKLRGQSRNAKRRLALSAWRDISYTWFSCSAFFGFLGVYIPFFYVQLYAQQRKTVSGELVFYLPPLLNAGSLFGRIIPPYLADKYGPLNSVTVCTLFASILAFVWISIQNTGGIVVFCLLFGFFQGAFVSLVPAVVAVLTPDPSLLGERLGMLFVPAAIGVLIGNPIAGVIQNHGWRNLQLFCGIIIFLSFLCMMVARTFKVGFKQVVKI